MFQRILHVAAALAALPIVLGSNPASACHGDCYKKVHTPAVYTTVAHPVVKHRAEVVHSPAVYATVHRTVEVAPARAHHSYTPPVYGHVSREVVVQAGGYRWQRTHDHHGHEKICRVYVPAVTRVVHAQVLVEPAHRVTHVTPAVYRNVHQTVLVQPASHHHVHRAEVVGYEHHKVLVRHGGHAWVRAH